MKNERECRLLKGVSLLENRYAASLWARAGWRGWRDKSRERNGTRGKGGEWEDQSLILEMRAMGTFM